LVSTFSSPKTHPFAQWCAVGFLAIVLGLLFFPQRESGEKGGTKSEPWVLTAGYVAPAVEDGRRLAKQAVQRRPLALPPLEKEVLDSEAINAAARSPEITVSAGISWEKRRGQRLIPP
jgi:hypothetical protein